MFGRKYAWATVLLGAVGFVGAQTPGPYGSQALRINAPLGNATVPASSVFMPAGPVTFEFWALLDPARAATTGTTLIPTAVSKGYSGGGEDFTFHAESQSGGLIVWSFYFTNLFGTDIPRTLASSLAMLPNTWHHVAATHDGATARLYLDGVLAGEVPAVGTMRQSLSASLRLGSNAFVSNRTWNGDLDEVRVWTYARSQPEIAADRFLRLNGAPGLHAAWHFDGDNSDYVGPFAFTSSAGIAFTTATAPVQPEVSVVGRKGVASGDVAPFEIATNLGALPYLFDVGFAGPYPGVTLPSPLLGVLPINPPWLYATYASVLPSEWFSGFVGVTNAFGRATPSLHLPAFPELLWSTFTGAAVLLDGAAPYGVRAVSNPATFVLTPPPPVLTSVSPSMVDTGATSTTLTVVGTGFTSVERVRLGLAILSNVQVLSPSMLTCVAPPLGVGQYALHVDVFGEVSATLPAAVTYVAAPIISSVSSPYAAAGTLIGVIGSGFASNQAVTIGGVPAAFTLWPPGATNAMFVTVPPGVPCSGAIVVTNGVTGLSGTMPWNLPPVVFAGAASGPAAGGGLIVVGGGTFLDGTTVTVGGAPATILSMTTNQIQCLAPPGPVGAVPIVVTTPNGCPTTAAAPYVYL